MGYYSKNPYEMEEQEVHLYWCPDCKEEWRVAVKPEIDEDDIIRMLPITVESTKCSKCGEYGDKK